MPVASGCPLLTTAAPGRWSDSSRVPVMPGALVIADDWSGYASLRKRGYDHHAIARCGDPEVAEEFLPISLIVFSNLKSLIVPASITASAPSTCKPTSTSSRSGSIAACPL